jgi:hypothetical protein
VVVMTVRQRAPELPNGMVFRANTRTGLSASYSIGRSVLPFFVLLVSSCCPHPQVVAFTVEPPLACPGQRIHVRWDVSGRAVLRAQRGPADWDEEEVLSKGDRTVTSGISTTFHFTAIVANPAVGKSAGNKVVDIPALKL